jgi:hypothetical protein
MKTANNDIQPKEIVYEEPKVVYEAPKTANNDIQIAETVYEEPKVVYEEPKTANNDIQIAETVYEEPKVVYEEPKTANNDIQPEGIVYEEPKVVYEEPKVANNDIQPKKVVYEPKEEVEEEIFIKPGKRVNYTCGVSQDENAYIEMFLAEYIKYGIVENKNDFLRKAIDYYMNSEFVFKELNIKRPFVFNGKNCLYNLPYPSNLTPKLLKGSQLAEISKIESFI